MSIVIGFAVITATSFGILGGMNYLMRETPKM